MALNGIEIEKELEHLEREISNLRSKRKELLKDKFRLESVQDYTFAGRDGAVKLSELFGDSNDLMVIHNMGKRCTYCTLWADGFNGVYEHLHDRAPFYVISPDPVATQIEFAESRDWRFPMVSAADNSFTADMGFHPEMDGKRYYWPGMSTFRKHEDGRIERLTADFFGPGDTYSGIWHMIEQLADGVNNWQPRYSYAESAV